MTKRLVINTPEYDLLFYRICCREQIEIQMCLRMVSKYFETLIEIVFWKFKRDNTVIEGCRIITG